MTSNKECFVPVGTTTPIERQLHEVHQKLNNLQMENSRLGAENVLLKQQLILARDNANLKVANIIGQMVSWFDKTPATTVNTAIVHDSGRSVKHGETTKEPSQLPNQDNSINSYIDSLDNGNLKASHDTKAADHPRLSVVQNHAPANNTDSPIEVLRNKDRNAFRMPQMFTSTEQSNYLHFLPHDELQTRSLVTKSPSSELPEFVSQPDNPGSNSPMSGSKSPTLKSQTYRSKTPTLNSKSPIANSWTKDSLSSPYFIPLHETDLDVTSPRCTQFTSRKIPSRSETPNMDPRRLKVPVVPQDSGSPYYDSLLLKPCGKLDHSVYQDSLSVVTNKSGSASIANVEKLQAESDHGRTQQYTTVVPSTRLIGELAFQLDRRILNYVFNSVPHCGNRKRLYGYLVKNIPEMINNQVSGPNGNSHDVALASVLNYRYLYVIYSLKTLGYEVHRHADICVHLVNTYGLLPAQPDNSSLKLLHAEDQNEMRTMLTLVTPPNELGQVLLLLNCLVALAKDDKRPLFTF